LNKENFGKPILPDIPDIYADRVRLTVTVFGVNFTFGLSNPHPDKGSSEAVLDVSEMVRVRMSLEHAKIMAMMLKKQIKTYEESNQIEVAIPDNVLEGLNLKDETW